MVAHPPLPPPLPPKKNFWQNFLMILNTYEPKTQLIKALNSLDSSDHVKSKNRGLKGISV